MPKARSDQVIRLKTLAKESIKGDKGVFNQHLKGVDFVKLSEEDAKELIEKCEKAKDSASVSVGASEAPALDLSKVIYSKNYEVKKGVWSSVALTDEELEQIRSSHAEDCKKLMKEIQEDFDDPAMQTAMFRHRADKIFTRIEAALKHKVRMVRNGN